MLPKSYTAPQLSDIPCRPPRLSPPDENNGTTKLTLIACRTIHPGDELTVPYIPCNATRSERRGMLWDLYGFWCNCAKCEREKGKKEVERPHFDFPMAELNELGDVKDVMRGMLRDKRVLAVMDADIGIEARNAWITDFGRELEVAMRGSDVSQGRSALYQTPRNEE